MKHLIKIVILISCFLMSACNIYEQFKEELYKNVFCLVSGSDNIYSVSIPFDDEVYEGFVSIYCGGTNPVTNDVTIELEYDLESIQEYNELTFDLDVSRYAKWLDQSKYEIQTFSATMKAGQEDPYVTIPIRIFTEGITPDTIFFIPLKIKSITDGYDVNPEMNKLLYRPFVENKYAGTMTQTIYGLRGKRNGVEITGSKNAYPLAANQIRITVEKYTELDGNSRVNLDLINKYSIKLTVNSDNTVTIEPYGTIEIEQLGDPEDNRLEIKDLTRFYLSYRYRTLETPATEENDAVYSSWVEVEEVLRRQN
ncbi:BT_3044 domain-containing protein [Proteiniphilum sp. X52]|uniref:BT_3044 domain-containing protein n=1 Tax=Proteiniphilum sp. X52 TaxID=2382159 RepID=UPI000F09F889|nr:DUF4361 domain-containing protein [Proteiniphilum sp. X52]RNC65861.1 DUF4361 domain-containing protein [Proteiniphilum sp. X52]